MNSHLQKQRNTFVVLFSELDADKADSATHVGLIAGKIRAILADPYQLMCERDGDAAITVEHHCTSNIGVVLFIGYEANLEDIIKKADIAMYQAKGSGRNSICFYE